MLNIIIIVVAILLGSYLAFSKRLSTSSNWQATVTPLASIMGSGFLVSAPLLAGVVGNMAVFAMAVLLLLAYMVGGAIRFNIRYFEPIQNKGYGMGQGTAFLSRIILVGAYFISITYYLQLLSAFLLKVMHINSDVLANVITTVLLLIIGGIGIWRGLKELGAVEKYTVALNLGMIGALLVALVIYNIQLYIGGEWALAKLSSVIDIHDLRVLFGLLIVVQGFEISRYLGDEYPAEQRIKTMRASQIISAVIYLLFIALTTVLFHKGLGSDVTAIVDMVKPVAVVLPILIVIAAIGSQFSAAVADDSGAGGLIEDITKKQLPVSHAYLLILIATITLTWSTDVNSIIAYASRAFALFYMLQSIVAFLVAWHHKELKYRTAYLLNFVFIAVLCFVVFAFGIPSG